MGLADGSDWLQYSSRRKKVFKILKLLRKIQKSYRLLIKSEMSSTPIKFFFRKGVGDIYFN